jgi:RNA polymerase sigma factor (TIGR02999 family)
MTEAQESLTLRLKAWSEGDQAAGDEIITIVYNELRRLAAHYLQTERPDHTLQPTALVHELYLKLCAAQPIDWQGRGHFLAVAARQLRHLIIDYARTERAQKRGGGPAGKISLDEAPHLGANLGVIPMDERVLALDEALTRLEELDARAAKVVELRYFGGLGEREIGESLAISVATVKRDWSFARAWLLKELT